MDFFTIAIIGLALWATLLVYDLSVILWMALWRAIKRAYYKGDKS